MSNHSIIVGLEWRSRLPSQMAAPWAGDQVLEHNYLDWLHAVKLLSTLSNHTDRFSPGWSISNLILQHFPHCIHRRCITESIQWMAEQNILENGPDKPFLCCCQEQLNVHGHQESISTCGRYWFPSRWKRSQNYSKTQVSTQGFWEPNLSLIRFVIQSLHRSLYDIWKTTFSRGYEGGLAIDHIFLCSFPWQPQHIQTIHFSGSRPLWTSLFLFPMLLSEMSRKLEVPTPLPHQTYRIDVYPHGSLGLAAWRRLWDCGRDRDREWGKLNASLQAGGLHQRSIGW